MNRNVSYNASNNGDRKPARFLGDPTPAKAAGFTFSLAVIFPVVIAFVFILILSALGRTGEETQNADWYLYANFLLSQLAFALAALCCFFYAKTSVKQVVASQKCQVKYFLVAIFMQVGLLALSELNTLFLQFLGGFGYESTPIRLPSLDGFGFVGVLFVVGVLPSIFEEIVFRGILLNGLKSFGKVGAILLCGALFALFHQNPAQTLYQFCCGVAFALVALKAGSILPTVLAHFLNNATILLLEKMGVQAFPTPVFVVIVLVSSLCLIGTVVYLLVFDKEQDKRERLANQKQEKQDEQEKQERKRFFLASSVGIAVSALTWLSVLIAGL